MGGRWRTCGDERVCEACQTQEGGHWTGEAGVPPHPGCTNPDGCRCSLMADEVIATINSYLKPPAGVLEVLEESLGVELELLEETGDPSIIATPRIVPAHPPDHPGVSISEEEWRNAPAPLMGSGFLSYHEPPPPPAPWWRVLVWLVRDVLERIREDLRFRWERAARHAAEELERSRDNANRD